MSRHNRDRRARPKPLPAKPLGRARIVVTATATKGPDGKLTTHFDVQTHGTASEGETAGLLHQAADLVAQKVAREKMGINPAPLPDVVGSEIKAIPIDNKEVTDASTDTAAPVQDVQPTDSAGAAAGTT